MKNTGQYKFTARKIIERLTARLAREEAPLYADWLISLMREGFSKDDAVEAFRQSDFVLLHDQTIILRSELHRLRVKGKLTATPRPEVIEKPARAGSNFAEEYDEYKSFLDRYHRLLKAQKRT